MDTDYNSLLGQMINSPFASPSDRERMVTLLLRDHDSKYVTREQVEKMIGDINRGNGIPEKPIKRFNHNPIDMVKLLYQFSFNEELKYLTHDPDADMVFLYSDYISKAKIKFDELTKKLSINTSTFMNISNFIFDTGSKAQDAYDKRIEIGWKEMSEWCIANKGKHPYDVLIGDYRFEHYINLFKNAIQFRTDNSDYLFSKRVRTFIQNEAIRSSDIKITFKNNFRSIGSGIRTFIDVRQLFKFLRIIGKWIIENKAKGSTVVVDLSESDNSYSLIINHEGSSLNLDDEKLKGLSGDFRKARNILLNVADWTIQADEYRRGALNICCLGNMSQNVGKDVVSENIIDTFDAPIGGVKHIITFYKNI